MGSFALLFMLAGGVLAVPVLIAIVDSLAEAVDRVRRALPSRTTHAELYARDAHRRRV